MQRYIKWFIFVAVGLVLVIGTETYLIRLGKHRDGDVDRKTERVAKGVAEIVARHLKSGLPADDDVSAQIFKFEPQISYVVIDDWIHGLRTGQFNARAMLDAPMSLREQVKRGDFEEVAGYLVQDGKGGASPGFEVLRVELRDETDPSADPKAIIKMGYVIPGYLELYRAIWVAQFALLMFVLLFVAIVIRSARAKNALAQPETDTVAPPTQPAASLPQEVDLLEETSPTEQTEIVAISQSDEVEHEHWIDMLAEDPAAQWEKRGSWYAISDFVLASPWRASLVRSDIRFAEYVYRVKAKKLVGSDGFVVLFPMGEANLVWVLGGWNNTRNEVAGQPDTQFGDFIETNRWYDLTVEVFASGASGYVNGDKKWELKTEEVKDVEYKSDFLPGIGVACWNTVVKFKDLYILDKSDVTNVDVDATEV